MKSIMYHYVRSHDKNLPNLNYLHFKNFEKQIQYFKKKYQFFDCNDFLFFLDLAILKIKYF